MIGLYPVTNQAFMTTKESGYKKSEVNIPTTILQVFS
jgi:hypothetical protein